MRYSPPSRRVILYSELTTAAWSCYAISFWYQGPEMELIFLLPIVDLLVKAAAAIVIGVGAWRGRAWAPVWIIALAAYVGIPNVAHVGAAVQGWVASGGGGRYGWVQTGWLVEGLAQLLALLGGLHLLKPRQSAA
jgi:hypothetical protein